MTEITANTAAPAQEQAAPTKDYKGLMRPLIIRQLDHGYTIEIGCKSFAFGDQERLIQLLTQYIQSPDKTEVTYYEGTLFQKQTV